nr:hypothetical protein [Mycoplasmopsis columbinasalis]
MENNFSKDYDSSIQTNLTEKHKFILLKTDEEFKDYEMMPSTKRFKYNNKFFIKSEDNKNDLFYMFLVCNIEKLVVDGKKATLEMFREEAIKYLDLKLN